MHRVIVVEDEELIRTMLQLNLSRNGYDVTCCEDAETMLKRFRMERYDVCLLDIMLPGMQGDEALKILRERGVNVPVLMLTAKRDIKTRVESLDLGADDYLAKPFDMDELLARVRALIRRSQGERTIPSHNTIIINGYRVNLDTRQAESTLGKVSLSPREADLLAFFACNPGKTLSRNDILDEVWGMNADPTPRTIDNFIVKFRKLFETNPDRPEHFITVRSTGYRFEP